ncbi:MAG: LicD family protein [Butyrivibrio sp.]|nr:LicD family protein [Butyrivibrio sp.]
MHDYLNEHQRDAVEALECLKKICDENGIRFYLLAGTTLGAVRHKGMIPWDDDVDVGLLYEDWYRLRKVIKDGLKGTKFTYIDEDEDKTYPRLFGKILCDGYGCVDLFLIVKWTTNKFFGKIHWLIKRFAVLAYKCSIHNVDTNRQRVKMMSFKKKAKHYLFRYFSMFLYFISCIFCKREDYIRLARWNEKYYEGKDTGWYVNLYSIYPMTKEMIKGEWIENTSYVEYEGGSYMTVGDTHAYLTHLYGDYMTPPPQKDRVNFHNGQKFSD